MEVAPMEVKAVLAEAVNCLRRARSLSPPKSEVESSALRWELYASLQNILDAMAMMASDLGLRRPSSYADLGVLFKEAGLIGEEACNAIKLMAVARNTLAHAYRRLTADDLDGLVKQILPKAERVIEALKEVAESKSLDPEPTEPIYINAEVAEVFKRHGVALAYLFGSRAKGLEGPESDYDIAVLFSKSKVTAADEVELALNVAQALRVPPDTVDVVALNNADAALKARILKEALPIYTLNREWKARWERQTTLQILHTTDLYAVYIKRTLERGLGSTHQPCKGES